jgi:hypothetical protein
METKEERTNKEIALAQLFELSNKLNFKKNPELGKRVSKFYVQIIIVGLNDLRNFPNWKQTLKNFKKEIEESD